MRRSAPDHCPRDAGAFGAGGLARAQEQEQLDIIEQQIESAKAAEARIAAGDRRRHRGAGPGGRTAQRHRPVDPGAGGAGRRQRGRTAEARHRARRPAGGTGREAGRAVGTARRRCSGWSRTRRPPWWSSLATSSSALRGAMLLGTLVPELRTEAEALALKLDQLGQLEAAIGDPQGRTMAQEIAEAGGPARGTRPARRPEEGTGQPRAARSSRPSASARGTWPRRPSR